jgi:hypothetical protein
MIGIAVEAYHHEEAPVAIEHHVNQALAPHPEIREMVEQLEEQQDEVAGFSQDEVPSGDAIAREFQRFLRQQND